MFDSVFFDMETMSTKPNAVVLSLGLLAVDSKSDPDEMDFDDLVNDGIELKFDARSQVANGRHVEKDTMEWWKTQGEEAKRVLKPQPTDIPFSEIIESINNFFEEKNLNMKRTKFYCRGPDFDFSILKDLYWQANAEIPIKYWNVRDTRTVIDTLLGSDAKFVYKMDNPPSFIHHNALHDCAMDVLRIRRAQLYLLNGKI